MICTAILFFLPTRVRAALGPEPLENARHLLQPIALPTPAPPLLAGPNESTQFVVDVQGPFPLTGDAVYAALYGPGAPALGFFRLWARSFRSPIWQTGQTIFEGKPLEAVALAWDLTGLLFEGREAAEELGGYEARLRQRFAVLGFGAGAREPAHAAAQRAAHLNAIKARFGEAVEMRLVPTGRAFPSRSVWRGAYALGLEWGDMGLFHWHEPTTHTPLFTLSSLGPPGHFLPERAVEGEGVPGIALSFELPSCPAPIQTYDRVGIALAFLRERLGGRPTTAIGAELDADALYDGRDFVEEADRELRAAHLAPGSPAAAAFF